LLSWSFRCLIFPSSHHFYYGWISALACEFGAKCNRRTISEREREKEETASEQREFSYHNIIVEEFTLSVFHCLQMFPQSESVSSVFFILFLVALFIFSPLLVNVCGLFWYTECIYLSKKPLIHHVLY